MYRGNYKQKGRLNLHEYKIAVAPVLAYLNSCGYCCECPGSTRESNKARMLNNADHQQTRQEEHGRAGAGTCLVQTRLQMQPSATEAQARAAFALFRPSDAPAPLVHTAPNFFPQRIVPKYESVVKLTILTFCKQCSTVTNFIVYYR